jgi:hypothetical protein
MASNPLCMVWCRGASGRWVFADQRIKSSNIRLSMARPPLQAAICGTHLVRCVHIGHVVGHLVLSARTVSQLRVLDRILSIALLLFFNNIAIFGPRGEVRRQRRRFWAQRALKQLSVFILQHLTAFP